MPYKILLAAFTFCFTGVLPIFASTPNVLPYENEHAIVFEANDGQTIPAFEGFIWVPENRNSANSRLIKVNYVRFPAKTDNKASPIVYLSGGPGGSGIATAKWRRFPLFVGLTEHADVIALDQRGTGQSNQLPRCQSSQTINLTEPTASSDLIPKYRKAALECYDFWQQQGIDVLGYTSVQNAWDLQDLRKHLGAKKISLWGISYGSHLALTAMSLFEQDIDKVVIASAEGLDQTVKLPSNTANYFSRVQAQLNKHPKLRKMVPNLSGLMRQVHQDLLANPIAMKIPTREGGEIDLLFQKHHMQILTSMTIADPNQYLAMLISVYLELSEGNHTTLAKVLSRGMFNNPTIEFRLMSMAMDVASGITEKRLHQIEKEAQNSLLGNALNFPMPHLYNVLPQLDLGDEFRTAKTNSVPTLLFTGTLDGRTYVEGQSEAVAHLQKLTHVTIENAGHNLFTSSPEVLSRMNAFFAGHTVNSETIVVTPTFIEVLSR